MALGGYEWFVLAERLPGIVLVCRGTARQALTICAGSVAANPTLSRAKATSMARQRWTGGVSNRPCDLASFLTTVLYQPT